MPPARITDLPTEILMNIFEHPTFPTKALYFLALLSRRLNYIALPIYCSRNHIDLGAKSAAITLHTDRFDILSVLQICLSISSMDRIACIFPHPSCSTIFPFLKQMKRVENFISGLSSVKEVSLTLDTTQRGRCLAHGTDEVLAAWATQLYSLLNCVVDRGCTSLTVINGTHLTEAYQLNPQGFLQNYLPLLDRDALALGFKRNPKQGNAVLPMPSFNPVSHLSSLNIDSITLILPPGLYWTIAVLRTSPITSLSIRMSHVEPDIWRTVLPLIASAAPNLTTVSLTELDSPSESHGAPGETLALAFLARLPHLTKIELTHLQALWGYNMGRDIRYFLHRTNGPTAPYRHLTTLRAPANIVAHLLSRPGGLPAILAICVLWISPFHPHLQALMSFLSTITRRLAGRRAPPQLSLWIELFGSLYDEDTTVLRKLSPAQLTRFKQVERIHFERGFPPREYNARPFLGPILGAFRGVEHVSLTTGSLAFGATVTRLVREVRATEILHTIEVDGTSYTLSKD
ncbi:hypothetical protein B0H19DRAFT_1233871 [Mycena capillaripes]|nr:hypothetical protein B0H19DRAFT_1233871 [Mycena capillaripes]